MSANELIADIDILRAVRVPDGKVLSELPEALVRANKVMGFDSTGNPVGVIPATGSGTELAIDLINSTESGKGTALAGFNARNLAQKLLDILDILDIRDIRD